MSAPINKLTIQGFKSIRSLEDFELGNLTVLIGPNGAGKSNFVSFFALLRSVIEQGLQLAVAKRGGADKHLYLGPKFTREVVGEAYFGLNGYKFALVPTADNRLVFEREIAYFEGVYFEGKNVSLGGGHDESKLRDRMDDKALLDGKVCSFVVAAVSSWVVYHFHDTGETAAVRRQGSVRDNEELRPDANNLGAFLLHLREESSVVYEQIRDTVRLVAPFFDDFKLRATGPRKADRSIQLEWTQRGSSYPFHPSQMSDGTLRFVCLAAALLQPNPPSTIILDEPELGLHPFALSLLAELIDHAASRTQVIVSTQSAALLDRFDAENVVVVDREGSESTFTRLERKKLQKWLKKYSLGELWEKNVIGGRPI